MYQVWTKEGFQDLWLLTECETLGEVEEIIRRNFSTDVEVKVTQPVDFDAKIVIKFPQAKEPAPPREKPEEPRVEQKEAAESETAEGGPKEDKGPRGKSHQPVR